MHLSHHGGFNWDDPQSLNDYPQPQYQCQTSFPTPLPPPTQQHYPFLQTMCVAPQNNPPLFHVVRAERGKTDDTDYNVSDRHEEAASAIDDQHPSYHSTHSHHNPWSSGHEASHHFAHGIHSAHQPTGGFVVQQPAPWSQHVCMPLTSRHPNQGHPTRRPHADRCSNRAQTPFHVSRPSPKPPHTKRACVRCRRRKQGCDKKQPCLHCERSDVPCVYPFSLVARDRISLEEEDEEARKEVARLRETIAVQGRFIEQVEQAEQERRDAIPTPAASKTLSEPEGFTPTGYDSGLDGHRTAPDELMRLWPSVESLLRAADADVEDDYVRTAESRPNLYDCRASGGSNNPDNRAWGDEFGSRADRSQSSSTNGFDVGGCLELSAAMMNDHFASFMERIYIMHPFVDATDLRKWFDEFLARYGPTPQRSRSDGVGDGSDLGWTCQPRGELFRVPCERSPEDAVVFLVLALGRICEHTGPLPAIALGSKSDEVDVSAIPGLLYYLRAVHIMKSEPRCDSLMHAQIFLLAGLYASQLARVRECMGWLARAGKILRELIDRHKLYNDNPRAVHNDPEQQLEKSTNLIADKPRKLIVLASWSCLQLESGILAELRLPSSGIWELEDRLPMPQNFHRGDAGDYSQRAHSRGDGYLDEILVIYSAQAFLQKQVNKIHGELYGCASLPHSLVKVCEMLRGHERILDEWRQSLPTALKWDEEDLPSSKPCWLDCERNYALHIMPYVEDGHSVKDAALDARGDPREASEVHILEAIRSMGDEEVRAGCRRCIEAAMQSTVAFDGVVGRLIVTNIHGTAHAQFGNVLVLCTAYFDDRLQPLVDREHLGRLLRRTIVFLGDLAPISPTCRYDCWILGKIKHLIFDLLGLMKTHQTYDAGARS
ncbi:hypothetical protein Q7P37_009883 [Cladosporium fusiforme]